MTQEFDIDTLIHEFRNLKRAEWKSDDYKDLLDPYEQGNWTDLQKAIDIRTEYLKEVNPQFQPRKQLAVQLEIARTKVKKMSKRSTPIPKPAEGGKKIYERGLPKREMNVPGRSVPKNEKPTVESMTIICEWLSKAIEKLKHATENEQYDFNVTEGRPEKTKKAAENLEAILDRLKRYRNSESEYKKKPLDLDEAKRQQYLEALNSWLEHIGKLFESPNLTFQLNPTVCPAADRMQNIDSQIRELVNKCRNSRKISAADRMQNIDSQIRELVNKCRKLEDENKKLEDDLKNRQGENSKNDSYENQVKQLQKQIEEYSTIIGCINTICKNYAVESSDNAQLPDDKEWATVKLVQRVLDIEKQKVSKVEGQLKEYTEEIDKIDRMFNDDPKQPLPESTASPENVSDRLKNKIARLKTKVESCCREIETIAEAAGEDTVPQNSQRRQRSDLSLKIALDKAKEKFKAIQHRLQTETSEKNRCIETFGALQDIFQQATSSSQRKQRKEADGKDLEKMIESVTDDIKHLAEQLEKETSVKNKCIEKFGFLYEMCQGATASSERKQTQEKYGKDEKDLDKMIDSVANGITDLTDKLDDAKRETLRLSEKLREANEISGQFEKEVQRLQNRLDETDEKLHRLEGMLNNSKDKIKQLEQENDDLLTRLSQNTSPRHVQVNPVVVHLSDQNRPTKLAEKFSELYDTDWTDAFDVLMEKFGFSEESATKHLFDIVQMTYSFCSDTAELQVDMLKRALNGLIADHSPMISSLKLDAVQLRTIHDLRKQTSQQSMESVKKGIIQHMKNTNLADPDPFHIISYVEKCTELCWYMMLPSPPLYLSPPETPGDSFDNNKYRYYLTSGKRYKFFVWPTLYLYKNGNMLAKGIAEGM